MHSICSSSRRAVPLDLVCEFKALQRAHLFRACFPSHRPIDMIQEVLVSHIISVAARMLPVRWMDVA